jgi:amidase
MQLLTREHLFRNQGNPNLPAQPPLRVRCGESFEVETADTAHRNVRSAADAQKPAGPMEGNPWTGPVFVEGIVAGEVIAVTIEEIRVDDHCFLPIGGNPFVKPDPANPRNDFIEISDGVAHFPGGIKVPVRPMLGCFGVVPVNHIAEPWEHGGNMDIPDICAGSTVHVRCQREGGYFACGDGHAVQGEGEINGFSLEVSLTSRFTINRSRFQSLQGILIETPTRIITVGIAHQLQHGMRKAVNAMVDLLVQARGMDRMDAYQLASHIGDVRLGAAWPFWGSEWPIPVPVCLGLDRSVVGW